MRKLIVLFVLFFSFLGVNSQELNSLVTINFNQVQGSNVQVFKTLEKSLGEFINQTKWTNKEVAIEERINCAFTIIIESRDNNQFTASLQVQSTRPVFNSTYETPILNIRDNDFDFRYNEFDPLIYNENSFDSNLVSTIVFYVNVILGVDGDTFKLNGGQTYLKEAENVMLQAQQSGAAAWQNTVGKQNRFLLIDNLLSQNLTAYRKILYDYHRKGMDVFSSNKNGAKQAVENAVISLDKIYNKTVGNYLVRLFFDAKSDEIVNIYSDETSTRNKTKLLEVVKRLSSTNNAKWKDIK